MTAQQSFLHEQHQSSLRGTMKVTLLGGGIGCSRLALPLARRLGSELTVVVNSGDDHWRYGLRICPDLDTNIYALSGLQDRERGWGVAGDTFRAMDRLAMFGEDPWFNLGDLDLAMHLSRTAALAAGSTLTEFAAEITKRLGIDATILPMTDQEVETRITTPTGEHSFEEYFVRDAALEPIEGVRYRGIVDAVTTPHVIEAIVEADLVLLGPSNPMSSIGPILALPGVRDAVAASACIAVTPVISGVSIVDEGEERRARSRAAQLESIGLSHNATSVASLYADLADIFVLDGADKKQIAAIKALGLNVATAPTILADDHTADDLASLICDLGVRLTSTQRIPQRSRT
ncbi:MAG: 2-phospho-L-lactate transferase [Acidimicrobiales bacterium]